MPANNLSHQIECLNNRYVIVGHGLAGAVLAHTIIERGLDAIVLEANMPHSATRVSAGLINPFIGPKLNIPEDFSACMSANQHFFKNFERKVGRNFLESIELYRVLQSLNQKRKWNDLSHEYKKGYLSKEEALKFGIISEFGVGITASWKLNSSNFINCSREVLRSNGNYFEEGFDPEKWRNHQVIFCEGFRVNSNKWFMNLPLSPAQGEVLTVNSNYRVNASNGTWHLAEKGTSLAKIGSTWKHENLESGPTCSARQEILNKLEFLPDLKNSPVVLHESGVRSSTQDRHPLIGLHSEMKNYYLFNGFGSRGCTTIPLCAKELTDFIIDGANLPRNKNLHRFPSN